MSQKSFYNRMQVESFPQRKHNGSGATIHRMASSNHKGTQQCRMPNNEEKENRKGTMTDVISHKNAQSDRNTYKES